MHQVRSAGRWLSSQQARGGAECVEDQRRFLHSGCQPQRLAQVIGGHRLFTQRGRYLSQPIVTVRLTGVKAEGAAGSQRLLEIGARPVGVALGTASPPNVNNP